MLGISMQPLRRLYAGKFPNGKVLPLPPSHTVSSEEDPIMVDHRYMRPKAEWTQADYHAEYTKLMIMDVARYYAHLLSCQILCPVDIQELRQWAVINKPQYIKIRDEDVALPGSMQGTFREDAAAQLAELAENPERSERSEEMYHRVASLINDQSVRLQELDPVERHCFLSWSDDDEREALIALQSDLYTDDDPLRVSFETCENCQNADTHSNMDGISRYYTKRA